MSSSMLDLIIDLGLNNVMLCDFRITSKIDSTGISKILKNIE